jgi:excisionase family DNA binding protein
MQVDSTRNYRVSEVAEHFNVSASTIYRAIESGLLDALRLGTAVRVPGLAVLAYTETCGQAAYVVTPAPYVAGLGELSPRQAEGSACVVCGTDFPLGASRRPLGRLASGSQVFACTQHTTHDKPGVGVAR